MFYVIEEFAACAWRIAGVFTDLTACGRGLCAMAEAGRAGRVRMIHDIDGAASLRAPQPKQ